MKKLLSAITLSTLAFGAICTAQAMTVNVYRPPGYFAPLTLLNSHTGIWVTLSKNTCNGSLDKNGCKFELGGTRPPYARVSFTIGWNSENNCEFFIKIPSFGGAWAYATPICTGELVATQAGFRGEGNGNYGITMEYNGINGKKNK